MKKLGFTLAEVLITMAIIGVIAAVTLPSLNVNVTEQAAVTKYKKAIATLSTIGTIVAANDRMDYSSIQSGVISDANRGYQNGQLRNQIWAVFDRYGKIDRNRNNTRITNGPCAAAVGTIYFKDGTALCYRARGNNNFITGWIDINGTKSPNREFQCADANCNNRTVGDQFPVTLAGEDAFPGTLVGYANERGVYPAALTPGARAALWVIAPETNQGYVN